MVDVAVIDENTISLDGTLMPIARPVQRFLASIYPGKVVVGDTGRDSNPNASPLALSDWSGGIGLFKDEGTSPQPRAFFSTASLRYKSLTLPGLEVETAASGEAGVFKIGALGERANEVFAVFGTKVHKYDNGADSWGSSLQTLPQAATDNITVRMGGTEYLIFAHTTGYTYFDGTTWTEDTTKTTKYLEFWDDKLYGIGAEGLLWNASTIGTENNDAQLPLPDNSVTSLFTARDNSGTIVVYAGTTTGLFAHDTANTIFHKTEVEFPVHEDGAKGTTNWRGSVHTPAGLAVYNFINGSNNAVLTIEGPDLDDGMPSGKGGTIVQLVNSHNDLLALNDATVVVEEDTLTTQITDGIHNSSVMDPDVGFSSILGLNDSGWEVKFLSASTDEAITWAIVSSAYGEYRLWFAMGERISYIRIPSQIINPNEISDLPYAASAEHDTPWFNVGQMEVNKLGLRIRVEVLDTSANDTVKVEFRLDLSTGAFTTLGTITTDGVTTFELPNATTPTGTAFLWIMFRITLVRGSTTTVTPQMVNLTLEYRKKLPGKRGFSVLIDLNDDDFKGNTPEELLTAIDVATAKDLLVPFLFRSEDDGTETFYVDVSNDSDSLNTGEDHRGNALLQLTER